MKSKLFIVFTIFISSLEAARFRCDYKYHKDADYYVKYHEIPANWQEAQLRCHLEGATLASPLTIAIKEAMTRTVNRTKLYYGVWTGIHSTFGSGDYTSMEGIPLKQIPHTWMQNEPDNHGDGERCIVQLADGSFADGNCTETLPYFCYKKAERGMIMTECGTNDKEYTLDKRTGKCYKFHRFPRTWSRGYMTCMAEGGHLAIINSDAEADILKELFNKYPAKGMVGYYAADTTDVTNIGFYEWNDREFRTIHGQTLEEAGYTKWGSNEPNNPGIQLCGAMYRNSLLDDYTCEKRATFICEKDPYTLTCDEH